MTEQAQTFLVLYGPDLVGIILPPLIESLNRYIPEDDELKRFGVSVIVCFFVAFCLKFNQLILGNPEQTLTSFAVIFTESQAVYRLYFKDSWLRAKIRSSASEENPVG